MDGSHRGDARMMIGMFAACMAMCVVPLLLVGGAGSVLLGLFGGVGGWVTGGALVVLAAVVTAVLYRRRARHEAMPCCPPPTKGSSDAGPPHDRPSR